MVGSLKVYLEGTQPYKGLVVVHVTNKKKSIMFHLF